MHYARTGCASFAYIFFGTKQNAKCSHFLPSRTKTNNERRILIVLLMLSFIIIDTHSYITIIHSFKLHHSPRPFLLYPHRFSSHREIQPVVPYTVKKGFRFSRLAFPDWNTFCVLLFRRGAGNITCGTGGGGEKR
jgi:hypothetical protein